MKKFKNYIIVVVLYIVMLLLAVLAGKIASHIENSKLVYEPYSVKTGDTLWTIAEEYTSNEYDVRKTVRIIIKTNGIENAVIHSGDVIYVPLTYRGN